MSNNRSHPFYQKTCAMCGKKFVKQPGSIYHTQFAGKSMQFCSYTCYKQGLEVKENTNQSQYIKYQKEAKEHAEV